MQDLRAKISQIQTEKVRLETVDNANDDLLHKQFQVFESRSP